MSPPASSSRRRPAESDVYTWLMLVAALFMIAANVMLFMPLHDWYGFPGDQPPASTTPAK